jgi:hypothetical protein
MGTRARIWTIILIRAGAYLVILDILFRRKTPTKTYDFMMLILEDATRAHS